jgi:lysophospholipase L1-like esterase
MLSFLLLGDSITEQGMLVASQGWGALLAEAYIRRAQIYPRGFSGYNTRWLRHYLERPDTRKQILPHADAAPLDLAVIFLGANDAVLEGVYQHVPVDEYKENLVALAFLVGARNVVFVTPPPYSAEKYMATTSYSSSHRTDERSELYAAAAVAAVAAVEERCKQQRAVIESVSTLNINAAFRKAMPDMGWVEALSDGLHFGPAANKLMCELLVQHLSSAAVGLSPDAVPWLLPSHRDFAENGGPELEKQE